MSDYDLYATTLVKEIPGEILKEMVNVFIIDAGINMGSEFTDKALDRVIETVQGNFRYLPLCYIASAFKKGSLGSFGAGRLVPRTIYGWMIEISLEYSRDQVSKKRGEIDYVMTFDLKRYPVGSAICRKIDWFRSGLITPDEWDMIPLKEMSELIREGVNITPADFGIKI
jgi:hypothetical protein